MFRLFDTLRFTLERIRQHMMLVIWVLVGLGIATTLSLSLTLYVDAVYTGLLDSRLSDPPYASRFRYLGAWNGNIGLDDVNTASSAVQNGFTSTIGLPVDAYARFVRGGVWSVRTDDGFSPGAYSLGTLSGADSLMTIITGQWPPDETALPEGAIPVMISEALMFKTGLQVGDQLTATRGGGGNAQLVITALWRPTNETDPAWIFPPKFFDEVMLIQPEALWSALEGIENPVDEAAWFIVFDGQEVRTADVDGLRGRLVDGERLLTTVLPGMRTDLSPQEGLTAFSNEVGSLQAQLVIIIAPVGGLVLYFVSLVAGLLVSRQQPEDVKLRSRGMSRRALLIVHFLMWLLLVGFALGTGVLLAPRLVQLVSQTSSFLRFDTPAALDIQMTGQAILIGGVTGLIAASSGLYMAWRTTGQNINSFRQNSARARQAWWQRAYLDVLILFPAAYVLWTLWQSGGLVTSAETPFSDPLAFVGPTLFALGLALVFLRVWPFILNIGARLMSYTSDIPLLMALRELTRSIGRYRGALLMMAFTLSLTGFTASMASTLDQSLADTINYRIGADIVLETAIDPQTEDETDETTGETTTTVTGYNIPPVEDIDAIAGVNTVSRVGHYPSRITIGSQRVDGEVLGMDRAAMAAVTRFREDYAAESLAGLLNKLAGQRTGVLINRRTAQAYNLVPGQEITLEIQALNTWYSTRVPIVDFVDYFPTLDPNAGFFIIANIEPIWEMAGTTLPHDLWLDLDDSADPEAVKQTIIKSGFPVLRFGDPNVSLSAAQAEPARRGVLGFLSVGFVAAIVLTLIASIVQSTASFRAQSAQLGALRAMGLARRSVSTYVILLQGMATVSGIFSGTSIGVATTLLFLPLLDFSGGLPPYLVRVAWDQIALVYIAFAGVLFGVTALTTIVLSREQLATIVRLGEG